MYRAALLKLPLPASMAEVLQSQSGPDLMESLPGWQQNLVEKLILNMTQQHGPIISLARKLLPISGHLALARTLAVDREDQLPKVSPLQLGNPEQHLDREQEVGHSSSCVMFQVGLKFIVSALGHVQRLTQTLD